MLLGNTQVSKLCKAFANNSSTNIKLSKTELHKIRQLEGFVGRCLRSLLKTSLPFIDNVVKTLAKNVLMTLRLTAAISAIDAAFHKKILWSGNTALIISNEEMNDIMKIVKLLEVSDLLTNGISEAIKNEGYKERGISRNAIKDFLSASLMGNILTYKDKSATGKGTIRASQDF